MKKIWLIVLSVSMLAVILFAFTGCGESSDNSYKSIETSEYQIQMAGYDIVGKEINLYVEYTNFRDDFGRPYNDVIPQAYQDNKLLYISETWPDNYMAMVLKNETVTITFHFELINSTSDVDFSLFKGSFYDDADQIAALKGEVNPILTETYTIDN